MLCHSGSPHRHRALIHRGLCPTFPSGTPSTVPLMPLQSSPLHILPPYLQMPLSPRGQVRQWHYFKGINGIFLEPLPHQDRCQCPTQLSRSHESHFPTRGGPHLGSATGPKLTLSTSRRPPWSGPF